MAGEPDRPHRLVAGEKELFVDRKVISNCENVEWTLNPLSRHPENPVITGSEAWERWMVYPNGRPVIYDDEEQTFKMWYLTPLIRSDLPTGVQYRVGYAESEDGLHWEKPDLGFVEWEGEPTNLLPYEKEGLYMRRPSIIKDTHDPDPSRRYKMMYADWLYELDGEPLEDKVLKVAYSEDGINWDLNAGDDPLHPRRNGNVVGWDPELEEYVRYGRGPGEDVRYEQGSSDTEHPHSGSPVMKRSASPDFENWGGYRTVLTPSHRDESFRGLAAFQYEGYYLGWLWVAQHYEDRARYDLPELIVSRDGVFWERPFPNEAILSKSDDAWDSEWLRPVAPAVCGDKIWCYYGGTNIPYGKGFSSEYNKQVQEGLVEDGQRIHRAVGLATLRLDGFVSMQAGAEGGTIRTVPLEFAGDDLYVNADAAGGHVRIAVLAKPDTPSRGSPPRSRYRLTRTASASPSPGVPADGPENSTAWGA